MATLTTPDEGMRQDFQTGMGLAQGFMGNYWKAKENQVEQERYRAGQALRDVQLSLAQTNLETMRNAAVLDAQARSAVPEFMGLMARSQVRGYDDDSQRLIFEFGQKNPGIIRSPLWTMQMENYNASKKAEQEKDEFDRRIQTQLQIARIREGEQVPNGGTVPVTYIKTKNGKEVALYYTGSTWQPLDKNDIDPNDVAVPIVDKTGKPVPGSYTFGNKILKAPENVYSVFGGGGQAAPASPAVAPTDGKATAVLKFDKSGNQIK